MFIFSVSDFPIYVTDFATILILVRKNLKAVRVEISNMMQTGTLEAPKGQGLITDW